MRLEDFLDKLGIHHKGAGQDPHATEGWIQIQCPWCDTGTGKHHLGISVRTLWSSCWKCGPHSLLEVLSEITGEPERSFSKALGSVDRIGTWTGPKKRGKLVVPQGVGPLRNAHKRYLRLVRGLDPDDIQRLWGVQGISVSTRSLSWRLWIPITLHGETVSWTTRALSDTGMRYLSAPPHEESVSHKSLLFGEDYLRHAVVVCEGPFDVFKIGPGAAAVLGTTYTRAQVLRMARYPLRIVCFDKEPEAQQRARTLCRELGPFDGRTWNVILDSKDPGSATDREIRRLRKWIE
jgi:hypothetical protein